MSKKFNLVVIALILVQCFAINVNVFGQTNKSVSILGDSYSTFEDFIVPDTNETWYFRNIRYNTDVNQVTQTWWHQYIRDNGYKLCVNNSYSGATICYTGYNKADYKSRSYITRMDNLGCPDIIFVFGGTNDCWAKSPIGEYKYDGWQEEDFYSFRPALAYLVKNMIERYPNTEIYFILNSELTDEINESMRTICSHYNMPLIELHDIDKKGGHPSIKGMATIADQIREFVKH